MTGRSLLAIDPGPLQSGWAWFDANNKFEVGGVDPNGAIFEMIYENKGSHDLAIEMIASYGMAVGKEIFDTCVIIGRFQQAYMDPESVQLIFRREVKSHLCGSVKAKDANVRQAIIDQFPATGGGKVPQIGTKAEPGPLYGVASHAWAAIGVGLTARNVNPHRGTK